MTEMAAIKRHYQDLRVASAYDEERFTGLVGRLFDRLEKRAIRRAIRLVQAQVPRPRVLDAPCGTGRITEVLLQSGLEVSGADISEAMLEIARGKCAAFGPRFTTMQVDLEATELPERAYDLVTCIRLFHHLNSPERQRVLANLARMSTRYVMVNISYSSGYYRFRRRVKRFLGWGHSAAASTWQEMIAESRAAGLAIVRTWQVLPFLSEDLVVLLELT